MKKFQHMLVALLVLLSFCNTVIAASPASEKANLHIATKLSATEFQSKYDEARMLSLAANTCAGTYVNDGKAPEYTYLGEYGWEITPYVVDRGKVEATFMTAKNTETKGKKKIGIIAFRGSKSKKDWAINFTTNKVEFGGTNLKEFQEFAEKKDVEKTIPQVHKGFNEYVMTAFSLQEDFAGDNIKENIAKTLMDNPNFTLLITGHSLGGAAATLMAERLVAMGIPKEQVPVVTFGAPAIGNRAFVEQYEDKINLTRVVNSLDPVPGSLQSFFSGYKQFETVKTLKVSAQDVAFQHPISLYFDLAMKNFYDVTDEGVAAGYLKASPSEIRTGKEPLVAIFVAESKKNINSIFAPYIRRFVLNEYKNMLPSYVVIDKKNDTHRFDSHKPDGHKSDRQNAEYYNFQEVISEAKSAGAEYVIILETEMKRMGQTDTWFSTLNQGVFKAATGRLVTMNATATRVTVDQGAMQSIVKDMEECRDVLKDNLDFLKIAKPLVW